MNFNLTEEHIMIRDAARDFAKTELLPGVIERDENQTFPNEQIKKLGELGFMGMMVDQVWWCWYGYHFIRFGNGRTFPKLMLQHQ